MVPFRRFDHLLPHPCRRRMRGHVHVLDAAPGVRDDEEDVHRPKRQGRDGEEVRRPDYVAMVAEEDPLVLRRRPPQGGEAVAADCLGADVVAEGPQLGSDAHGTPVWVFSGESENELTGFEGNPPPPVPPASILPRPAPAPVRATRRWFPAPALATGCQRVSHRRPSPVPTPPPRRALDAGASGCTTTVRIHPKAWVIQLCYALRVRR